MASLIYRAFWPVGPATFGGIPNGATGMPRELKSTHAVLAMARPVTAATQGADCAGSPPPAPGAVATAPNPKLTPDDSVVDPPSAAQVPVVFCHVSMWYERPLRSTNKRA